ncbi:MAG: hypothetical protein K2X93_28715 [Candidatus Obscuribacterales bacterium]|nr:hypothetical protein [Candidatus Obscuribacterales bacterium]
MKNFMINLGALVLVTALSIGAIVWFSGGDRTTWPDFGQAQRATTPLAPAVVAKYERDFGWRIGDVIPIELYLHQEPGTLIDLHSLAIEGDFEIVENPTIVTRDFKDGSRNVAIKFKIQSMAAAKKLTLKVSMLYRVKESMEDHLIAIPAFEPFTSPTWDGRDVVKDGNPQYRHEGHLLWTIGYILVGVVGAVGAFFARRRFKVYVLEEAKREWETRRETARREFDEAWARFDAGDFSDESYKLVVRCIRKLFRIESKVMREIEVELGSAHPYREQTLKILNVTGKVLYQLRKLTRNEHNSIKSAFDEIVPLPAVPTPEPTAKAKVEGETDDKD